MSMFIFCFNIFTGTVKVVVPIAIISVIILAASTAILYFKNRKSKRECKFLLVLIFVALYISNDELKT